MTRLLLAICPTNQVMNPVLGGGSEMEHIMPLAAAIYQAASEHPAITAMLFTGRPDTQDSPPGSLSGLFAQQQQAADWIRATKRDGDLAVSLNLHSDSGYFRHCGYYGPHAALPISEWLGRALAEAVKGWFGKRILYADYSRYIFATAMLDGPWFACPVLLEMGSHQMAADVAAVRDHAPEIASELVGTMLGFFGLETTPPLNISELRSFGEWALARCQAGEDPRIRDDFSAHIAAIGADPSDLSRWGWPT